MTNIPVVGSFIKLAVFLGGSLIYTIAWIAYRLLRIVFRILQSVLVAIAFAFLGAAYFNATSPTVKSRIGALMQWVVGETPKSERNAKSNHMIDRVRAGGRNPRSGFNKLPTHRWVRHAKIYDRSF